MSLTQEQNQTQTQTQTQDQPELVDQFVEPDLDTDPVHLSTELDNLNRNIDNLENPSDGPNVDLPNFDPEQLTKMMELLKSMDPKKREGLMREMRNFQQVNTEQEEFKNFKGTHREFLLKKLKQKKTMLQQGRLPLVNKFKIQDDLLEKKKELPNGTLDTNQVHGSLEKDTNTDATKKNKTQKRNIKKREKAKAKATENTDVN